MPNELTKIDGSMDWSEGVNSYVVATIQSERNPNGLKRTQVAWMDNATVRGNGITQRLGWSNNGTLPVRGYYQGQFLYRPNAEEYYLIMVIDGQVFRVNVDDPASAINLSSIHGVSLPITERVYFCQAEQFLIIQAGDGVTLPLFWDNATLRSSIGIVNPAATPASGPHINEIPQATVMCYYMGRVWYARGRTISAGDIVGGVTGYPFPGPPYYDLRDSVLCVQENPLCVGGDGFSVPTNAGNIRGIAYASNINTQLGQGTLYVGTREQIYALNVPVTRTDWISAGDANQPQMVVALQNNGWVNDRSIVAVNGDLFYQSLEPAIRSITTAVRNFQQWGNTPISVNENRVLAFNDRSMMRFSSGIYFDNRMLQTALPWSSPVGIAHRCLIPLNFDVLSTFERSLAPCWEGMWEGMDILELSSADFGGRQRAFASVWSPTADAIQLWELTNATRWDNDSANRVSWYIEFPSFTWGNEFQLKKLVSAELWLDKILGTVLYQMDYRPDGDPCWYTWHKWQLCSAKDTCEDFNNPNGAYCEPLRESFRQTITLPKPPIACEMVSGRPAYIGYQFQCRLTIKGWCRIRGLLLHAEPVEKKLYQGMVC